MVSSSINAISGFSGLKANREISTHGCVRRQVRDCVELARAGGCCTFPAASLFESSGNRKFRGRSCRGLQEQAATDVEFGLQGL